MSNQDHGLKTGGIYHHHKGGSYALNCVGRLENFPDTQVAVYQSVGGDGNVWVRSIEEFKKKFSLLTEKDEHSLSCLYQYELDSMNIPDTREGRLLFWSSKGAIKFGDKDNMLEPVFDPTDCPLCGEAHKERKDEQPK